jgi:hypothetical protein
MVSVEHSLFKTMTTVFDDLHRNLSPLPRVLLAELTDNKKYIGNNRLTSAEMLDIVLHTSIARRSLNELLASMSVDVRRNFVHNALKLDDSVRDDDIARAVIDDNAGFAESVREACAVDSVRQQLGASLQLPRPMRKTDVIIDELWLRGLHSLLKSTSHSTLSELAIAYGLAHTGGTRQKQALVTRLFAHIAALAPPRKTKRKRASDDNATPEND